MDELIDVFLKYPKKEFYVRELSRMLKKSPTTISKGLKSLEKKKILKKESKYSRLFFKPNQESKDYSELKKRHNIDSLKNSGLIQHLEKELCPHAIILFGSYEKGEDNEKSDIDLFILSAEKKEVNLDFFEKKLSKEIQLFIHSKKEFNILKEKNRDLANKILNGTIIYGFIEVF